MKKFRILSVCLCVFMLSSCSDPEDVSGDICGPWECEWDDNIGEGDVEDIRVKEQIGFIPSNDTGSAGNFVQVFSGEVDFDDWDHEQTLDFQLYVEGTWHVEKKDNVVLRYNMDSIELACGKSNVKSDYTSTIIDVLSGNWGSALVSGLMQESLVEEANAKINKAVEKHVLKFFKDMFRRMNMDKEAMTNVVITDDAMECEVNSGFFGRDVVYDRISIKESEDEVEAIPVVEEVVVTEVAEEEDYFDAPVVEEVEAAEEMIYYEPTSGSHTNTYSGTIGKYPIEMELTFTGYDVTGQYRYLKSGSGTWLKLQGCMLDDGTLSMSEWNNKGEITGTYRATISDGTFDGEFRNFQGDTFEFHILQESYKDNTQR